MIKWIDIEWNEKFRKKFSEITKRMRKEFGWINMNQTEKKQSIIRKYYDYSQREWKSNWYNHFFNDESWSKNERFKNFEFQDRQNIETERKMKIVIL